MECRLELKNLRKSFGQREILKGINSQFRPGEIIFILGTSGTGKSVLLKMIVGLLSTDEGEIFLNQKKISGISETDYTEIRKCCSMVFQQPALFDSMTLIDNVSLGLKKLKKNQYSAGEIDNIAKESIRQVHLSTEDSFLNQYPSEISYGMQKRLSLARTLALKPQVILFDEPTTGLDPVSTTAINSLIQEVSRKHHTTSIIVSHDMICALSIADRILLLDQGRVLEEGTPYQIIHSSEALVQEFIAEVPSKLKDKIIGSHKLLNTNRDPH